MNRAMLRHAWIAILLTFFPMPSHSDSPRTVIAVPYLDIPPHLDGILDDPAWQKAEKVMEFMQSRPREGSPLTENTTAYLGHDSDNLYIAFYAKDSEPSRIRAQLTPRDQAFGDDWVIVILDTFGDQRRAYEFLSNPLGIQMDLFSLAGQEDESQDFVWYTGGKIHEDGYVVEMKIPFKSLRFPKAPEQPWRLHVGRNIQRKNEKGFWPGFRLNQGSLFSQMADLKGLRNIAPGRRIELLPEMTASRAIPFESQKDSFHIGPWNTRAGANLRYGVTPNWTLDAAYNPDFSQVEADQPQIQVNQRFPLFFPEKRPFFMEGADLFSTPLKIVHTRTIVDPEYGIKFTGKHGPYSAALLSASDRSQNKSNFNIFRFNTDVGKESSLGMIYSGRELGSGEYNRVGGVDGRIRFNKLYVLRFQGVGSFSNKMGTGYTHGSAYNVSLEREARHFGFFALYEDLHPKFQADSGFFQRVDTRQAGTELWYNFWQSSGTLLLWKPQAGYWRTYDHAGTLTDEEPYIGTEFLFPLQTEFELTYFPSTLERFKGMDFKKQRVRFEVSSEPSNFLSGSLSMVVGDKVNYEAATPFLGNSLDWEAALTLKPTPRINIQQSYLRSRLDTKSGDRVFDENIYRSKLSFQWSKEISSRAIYQYSTLSHSGFASFLVSYLLTPGTAVHVGFDLSFARNPTSLQKTKEVFFTKISYLFRI